MPEDAGRLKLPVLKIVLESYRFSLQSYIYFIKWLLPAIVFVTIIEIPIMYGFVVSKPLASLLYSAIFFLLFSPVPVIAHRNIILGEDNFPNYFSMFYNKYYWKFVIAAISISVVTSISMLFPAYSIINLNSAVLDYAIYAIYAYTIIVTALICRFSLILPMKAVGHEGWAIRAWHISKGNTLRIAITFLLANIIIYALDEAFEALFDYIGHDDKTTLSILIMVVANLVDTLTNILYLSLNACVLSYAYRILTETKPDETT